MQNINLKQQRNIGTVLEDASRFIRENFWKMLKPTLMIVSVPIILGAIVLILGIKDVFSNMSNSGWQGDAGPEFILNFMGGIFIGYFFIILSGFLAYVLFIAYIKLYSEGRENINIRDLLAILSSKGISLALSSIVLVIAVYAGMMFCLIPGIYLSVVFYHFHVVSIIEDSGFGNTWTRCFYLIKDEWWPTFGLHIIAQLIVSAMTIAIYIPSYLIMFVSFLTVDNPEDPQAAAAMFSNVIYIIPVYFMIFLFSALIYATISSLNYFSLVEKKDGSGEKEMISQL